MATNDLIQLLESLHPLEGKVLLCFNQGDTLSASEILKSSGLDDSRLDMASGWLQSKGLLEVKDESITSLVSLTETGREYREKGIPEMRIINELREGKKFTVKDVIQSWGMDPTEVSSAVGALKASGVITIGQGGFLMLSKEVDLSSYEFLTDLIKKVAAKEPAELASFEFSKEQPVASRQLPQARQVQRHLPHYRKEEPFLYAYPFGQGTAPLAQ